MRIFGIDPGTAIVGWGVIDKNDDNTLSSVAYGAITTPAEMPMPERLAVIADDLTTLLLAHTPDAVAVEELFFFRNVTTAISVAQSRGVLLCTCQKYGVAIAEYTPLQVKSALTGYGRAEKKQVQSMVASVLKLKAAPVCDDTADALAVAICHAQSAALTNQLSDKL